MDTLTQDQLLEFHSRQLAAWPEVARRYADLEHAATRELDVEGLRVVLQHNPARIRSTAANTDSASVAARPCFLCKENRPDEQLSLPGRDYDILVNPYPIFRHHFTVVSRRHERQSGQGHARDMVDLARALPDMVVFFNGAGCGASAPDHRHFQIGDKEAFPLVGFMERGERIPVMHSSLFLPPQVQDVPNVSVDDSMMNALAWSEGDGVRFVVFYRQRHRPSFYGTGPGQMLVSPAGADMGGLWILPRREDYDAMTPDTIKRICREVCLVTNP